MEREPELMMHWEAFNICLQSWLWAHLRRAHFSHSLNMSCNVHISLADHFSSSQKWSPVGALDTQPAA